MLPVLVTVFSAEGVIERLDSQDASDITDNDEIYHAGQLIKIIATDSENRVGLEGTILIISQSAGYSSDLQNLVDESNGSYTFLWDTTNLNEASDYMVDVVLGIGQEPGLRSLTIKIDNSPPTDPRVVINEGEPFTTNASVRLNLFARDATEMYILGDVVDDANSFEWIPYSESILAQLTDGYEKKEVDVQFRDEALNFSETATAIISFEPAFISSQYVDDPTDDDEIYHAGQLIQLTVTDVQGRMELDGTISIKLGGYDSGLQELIDAGGGNYTYLWDTPDFPAGDYTVSATITGFTLYPLIITIDNDPPTDVSILINNDEPATSLPSVSLTISAREAVEMFIEGDVVDDIKTFEWIPYSPEPLLVNLKGRDGEKEVSVRFKDVAKNEISIADSIIFDSTPPAIRVVQSQDADNPADNDNHYHSNQKVKIIVETEPQAGTPDRAAESGLTGSIQIESENRTYNSGVQKLEDNGDGTYHYIWDTTGLPEAQDYRIEVALSDILDREVTDTSLVIILDNIPPQKGQLTINSGQSVTTSRSVSLTIPADEAKEMYIEGDIVSDSNTFQWIPYATQLVVNLTDEDGEKEISAKFRDESLNESLPVKAQITLDRSVPKESSIIISDSEEYTASRTVELTLSAQNAAQMLISGDVIYDSKTFTWIPYSTKTRVMLTSEDGEKLVKAKFRNSAKVEGEFVEDTIILDTTAPIISSLQSQDADNPQDADNYYHAGQRIKILVETEPQEGTPDRAETGLTSTIQIHSETQNYDSGTQTLKDEGNGSYSFIWETDGLPEAEDFRVEVKLADAVNHEVVDNSLTITVDNIPPQKGQLIINEGKRTTGSRSVRLSISAEGAAEMYLEGDIVKDSNTFQWLPYVTQLVVILTDADGDKEVFVKFRDDALNESLPAKSIIVLDRQSPQDFSIVIEGGKEYTASRTVTLTIDAQNALEMYIEGDVLPDANTYGWIKYVLNKNVTLTTGDGEKHVKVKFRNAEKIESEFVEDTVTFDSTSPAVQKVQSRDADNPQDNDDYYRAGQRIEILAEAEDSETGLEGTIQIQSQSAPYDSGLQTLKDEENGFYSYIWTTDGLPDALDYLVEVKLKDSLDREVVDNSLMISIDNTPPPKGQLVINDGQSSTDSRSVRLTISVGLGVASTTTEMYIEGDVMEDSNTFQWIEFASTLVVNLTDEEGEKEVSAKFRDDALNESEPQKASITLDRATPKAGQIVIEGGKSHIDYRLVTLTISAKNAVEIYLDGDIIDDSDTFEWIAFASEKKVILTQGDGEKRVTVTFRNLAQIESEPVEATVILDLEPPVISLIESQDATNPEDNDNYYHAGQSIKFTTPTEENESGLSGNIRIQSMKSKYDSGPQKLTDEGNGSYSYIWDTTGLKESLDYTVEAKLIDALERDVTTKMALIIDNTPPGGKITVNDNASRTISRSITLKADAKDAVEMYISGDIVDDTNTFEWITYPSEFGIVLNLTDGAGEKVISVKFKDRADNESGEIEATIILITTLPKISRVDSWDENNTSDNDEYYHAGQSIKFVIWGIEDEAWFLGTVRIKSSVGDYDSEEKETLDEGNGRYTYLWDTTNLKDGKYSVEAVLSDGISNEISDNSLSIVIDNTPPKIPSVEIDKSNTKIKGEEIHTASTSIDLSLADDAEAAKEIYIDGDIIDDTNTFEWFTFVETLTVNLTAEDGEKQISIKYRDAAENESDVAIKTIFLDTTGPSGSILINGDAEYTTSSLVSIEMESVDAAEMYLSGDIQVVPNSGELGYTFQWIPYASKVDTDLTEDDGAKTVKVTFKDDLGNMGEEIKDTITLDATPPKVESVNSHNIADPEDDDGRYHVGDTIKITPKLEIEESGLKGFLRITSETAGYDSGSQRLTEDDDGILSFLWETKRFSEAEDYKAEIKLEDAAGNETVDTSLILALVSSSVQEYVKINNEDEYTELESVELQIFSDNAAEMLIEGDVKDESNTFEWIDYKNALDVKLTPGDEEKTIQVTFRDKLQRESGPVEDTIILDMEAPKILAVKSHDADDEMDNDGRYHAGESIKFIVEPAEAETGLKGTIRIRSRKVSYDSGNQKLLEDGAGEYSYFWETTGLKEADDYIVEAGLEDLASHQTIDSASVITIDNTPPRNLEFGIRNSELKAEGEMKTRSITIKISAEDSVQMWIEGDVVDDTNTFEWIPFQSELVVNLTPGDGEKVIKVRHRDDADNESQIAEATIFLNEFPPAIQSVDSSDKDNPADSDEIYHPEQLIVITIKSAEAETGLEAMVQIRSVGAQSPTEENAYDSGIKRANEDVAHPDEDGGEVSYSYLWDTSGLKSASDYIVNVTLQDSLGQKAIDESLTITIDNEPPTEGKLTINNGEQFTNERRVLCEIQVSASPVASPLSGDNDSDSDATEMFIEGDVVEDDTTFKWVPILETKEVQLTEGDGEKTVSVKFRDEALNESLAVEASITLDTKAPTNAQIVINSGEIETDSRAVILNLLAEEATEMYIDGDVTESPNVAEFAKIREFGYTFKWIPYKTSKQVELTEGDGRKQVGIKYRDEVGNESQRIESSIILDQPGPTSPSIVINDGETYTSSPTVTLSLSAEGATEMYIDGDVVVDSDTFQWIPYNQGAAGASPSLQVNLIKSDGEKQVRARFRNGAGNESEQVEATIILDQTMPVVEAVESYDANNPSDNDGIYHPEQIVVIKAKAEPQAGTPARAGEPGLDGSVRIKSDKVKYDSGPQKLTDRGDGSYTYTWQLVDLQDAKDYIVEITLEDAVEHTAVDNSLVITIDSIAPVYLSVMVEDGETTLLSRSVKLNLAAGMSPIASPPSGDSDSDATEMFIEGDVINDTNTFQWIPFASEIVVNLAGNDAEKNIKVKFKDAAENESEYEEIKVILELSRPRLLVDVYLIQPDELEIAGRDVPIHHSIAVPVLRFVIFYTTAVVLVVVPIRYSVVVGVSIQRIRGRGRIGVCRPDSHFLVRPCRDVDLRVSQLHPVSYVVVVAVHIDDVHYPVLVVVSVR